MCVVGWPGIAPSSEAGHDAPEQRCGRMQSIAELGGTCVRRMDGGEQGESIPDSGARPTFASVSSASFCVAPTPGSPNANSR